KAQKVRTLIVKDFEAAFNEVDLIVGPVTPSVALPVGVSEGADMFGELQDILVEASSIAGLTSASVPCGFVKGLPVGLQLTGAQFEEQKVLEAANSYQQITDWHTKRPQL